MCLLGYNLNGSLQSCCQLWRNPCRMPRPLCDHHNFLKSRLVYKLSMFVFRVFHYTSKFNIIFFHILNYSDVSLPSTKQCDINTAQLFQLISGSINKVK